jgi:glycosyltransferase involved in cell wall biosynthesis
MSGSNLISFPLVDIVVPTYNQEDLIRATLDSILAQDYPNIRIIISDDASQDKTCIILKEYFEKHADKIVLNFNEKNLGITENLKLLYTMSDAPYLLTFAGDDRMHPDRVSKQVEALEKNPRAAGCMSDVEVLFLESNKKFIYRNRDFASTKPGRIIRTFNQTPSASLMMSRKVLGNISQDYRLPVVGDWLLVNQIAIKGLIYIKEPLTIYCRHSSNTTRPGVDTLYLDDRLVAIDLLFVQYKKYYFSCKVARSNVYLAAAIRYFKAKKISNALYFFWISWLECPVNSNLVFIPLAKLLARRLK